MKTQIGVSKNIDFEENTWTFKMDENMNGSAGDFAIIEKERYDKILLTIKRMYMSKNFNSNYIENSEFEMYFKDFQELIQLLEN